MDNNLSEKIENFNKSFLILGKEPTDNIELRWWRTRKMLDIVMMIKAICMPEDKSVNLTLMINIPPYLAYSGSSSIDQLI